MYQNDKYIEFIGWEGAFARFRIHRNAMRDGNEFREITVCHEGDWTGENAMICYPDFKHYEDVQQAIGKGLLFRGKRFREDVRRSEFRFVFIPFFSNEYILAVPATGEEIRFEIYGTDTAGNTTLLLEREL